MTKPSEPCTVGGPQRIQRKRTKGWRMPEGAVYVGRPSRWGNPFRILDGGHHYAGPTWGLARETWTHLPVDRCDALYVSSSGQLSTSGVVDLFRTLMDVRRRDEPDRLRDWLNPLRGCYLACWCPLDQPCHADVLLDFANPSRPRPPA